MYDRTHVHHGNRLTMAIALVLVLVLATTLVASANVALTQLSSDPYTNTTSFHKTQVEPDSFSFGSTIVTTFQSGRFPNGGASNIGWATSTNNGASWTNGFLPGTTTFATPAGPYVAITDPAAAFDAKHNVWLINSLGLSGSTSSPTGAAVIVNRSTNGGLTWGNPVTVAAATGSQDFDKNWIVCDDTATSAFYGNCYVEFDNFGSLNRLMMARSTNGGTTWSLSRVPRGATVIGGQPLVQPNGTVIMPIDNANETRIESFMSTNGGVSYSSATAISTITSHTEAGNLRSGPLPSAEIDGAGKVYVVWSDCRFETSCTANDIVMSTSTNGTTWTAPVRIPIDAVGSGVDHFIPGLAVDKSTSGGTAHLGLTYYYYPNTSCTSSTCQLDVGFVSSSNGGATWSAPTQLAGPVTLTWLPLTSQGYMVGDYISSSFSGGLAFGVFENATAGACTLGNVTSCNEFSVTNTTGLSVVAPVSASRRAGLDSPVANAQSDHAPSSVGLKAR